MDDAPRAPAPPPPPRTLVTVPEEQEKRRGLPHLTQAEGGGRRAALPGLGEMVPFGPERERLILDSTEPGWGTDSGDSFRDGHHLQEGPK